MINIYIILSISTLIFGLFLAAYASDKISFDEWYGVPTVISIGILTFVASMFFIIFAFGGIIS